MIKHCVVIGCGSHASSVISIIESATENYHIHGLINVGESYDPTEEKSGYKVIQSLNVFLKNKHDYPNIYCVLAIGDNKQRTEIFNQLLNNQFELPNIIANTVFIDRTVSMGKANIIAHGAILNAKSSIGNNNLINSGAVIEHHCSLDNHIHIAPKAVLCGGVHIADMVFIGANATIISNVDVSKDSILAAGAVLTKSITEEKLTLIGIPAKGKKK